MADPIKTKAIKKKIEETIEEIKATEVQLETKKSDLESAKAEELKAKAEVYRLTIEAKANVVTKANEELRKLKKNTVRSIRNSIKQYLEESANYSREISEGVDVILQKQQFVDMLTYSDDIKEKLNFALHRRFEHKTALTLKALFAEIFTNEGEKPVNAMNKLHGLPFLENLKLNKWLK